MAMMNVLIMLIMAHHKSASLMCTQMLTRPAFQLIITHSHHTFGQSSPGKWCNSVLYN